jgi:hypothetical protein
MRPGRKDGSRETLLFDFPAIKLSSGSPSVGGKNQDVMIQAGFTAIRNTPLGYSVSVGASGICRRRSGGVAENVRFARIRCSSVDC